MVAGLLLLHRTGRPEIERFHGVLGLVDEGVSPEVGQQLPQYVLEDMLRDLVAELPSCTFLVGSSVASINSRPDGVDVTVRAADGSTHDVRCDYLLGADGVRSVVREVIGARYQGSRAVQPILG